MSIVQYCTISDNIQQYHTIFNNNTYILYCMILLLILYQIFIGIVDNIKQYQKQNLCLILLCIVQYKTISNKMQQFQTKLSDNT